MLIPSAKMMSASPSSTGTLSRAARLGGTSLGKPRRTATSPLRQDSAGALPMDVASRREHVTLTVDGHAAIRDAGEVNLAVLGPQTPPPGSVTELRVQRGHMRVKGGSSEGFHPCYGLSVHIRVAIRCRRCATSSRCWYAAA